MTDNTVFEITGSSDHIYTDIHCSFLRVTADEEIHYLLHLLHWSKLNHLLKLIYKSTGPVILIKSLHESNEWRTNE